MEPVVCLDCGYPLGAYYELFMVMREYILNKNSDKKKIHIENKTIDFHTNESLKPIFDALNIKKICCKSQLISCRNMHDLEL